jgi:hypothetical protein
VTLLAAVAATLESAGVAFALIGAGALAAHRVARATGDLDLLTVAPESLSPATWRSLREQGFEVEIRVAEPGDPLAGVVRIGRGTAPPIDLIVGDRAWQRRAIERAEPRSLQGARIPIVRASDLVLLKLYAAGPQDLWDVQRLLEAAPDRAAVLAEVESGLADLGEDATAAWRRLLEG